jgi:DNA-binding XRE family transcriptional regulator
MNKLETLKTELDKLKLELNKSKREYESLISCKESELKKELLNEIKECKDWVEYITESDYFYVHPDLIGFNEFVLMLGGDKAEPNEFCLPFYRDYIKYAFPTHIVDLSNYTYLLEEESEDNLDFPTEIKDDNLYERLEKDYKEASKYSRARYKKGLNREQLAELSGTSVETICHLEEGWLVAEEDYQSINEVLFNRCNYN